MKVINRPVVAAELTIEEVKALQAMLRYGVDALLDITYKHLGRTYVEPYANGLHTLKQKVDSLDLKDVE